MQQLFFNNGPYTTAALTNRYLTLAGQIDKAVVAEAARWGDANASPRSPATSNGWPSATAS